MSNPDMASNAGLTPGGACEREILPSDVAVIVCLFAAPDGAGDVHDRHADGVAVFGPRTVVVAHIIVENLREQEPSVARALADAAIDDDGLFAVDAGVGI